MLTSIALVILLGMAVSYLFKKINLPGLLGMILTGILLGPYVLNWMDASLLNISAELRKIALVIILTRAGLSLDIQDLKKVGRPALLLCFVPACFEILGVTLLGPGLLHVSVLEAALLGSVLAAVSPAVVVPRMIKLMDEKYGTDKKIPHMILAGASVDDVFVIVVFTALTTLLSTGEISYTGFLQVPVSIVTGLLLGGVVGLLLTLFFKKCHIRDTVKLLIILSVSFLLLEVETQLEGIVPLSGLLAIMSMGMMIRKKHSSLAIRLSAKYNKLWLGAEIFLFVLVGAAVDIRFAVSAGWGAVLLVVGALFFRMAGVAASLIKTPLNKKERLFTMAAYTPKATVQAAIGAVPLSMGLACGSLVLTVAVLSILITAPFGAMCIDHLYKKLLHKSEE